MNIYNPYTGVYTNELYHHGILGMKWGIRRFQNKDGTLTSAGRKRYGEPPESVKKQQVEKVKPEQPVQKRTTYSKPISEMSDQELREVLNRIDLEEKYTRIMNERYEKAHPKPPESLGKKFLKGVGDVVVNSAKGAATDLAKGFLYYVGATTINKAAKKPILNTKAPKEDKKD